MYFDHIFNCLYLAVTAINIDVSSMYLGPPACHGEDNSGAAPRIMRKPIRVRLDQHRETAIVRGPF
jgi:hypothetical protein